MSSISRLKDDRTKFIKAVIYRQNDKRHKVNSDRQHDIAPDHERFSLRTNTISPMRKEYERTSDDHSNQKMVISGAKSQQQQRISMSKKRTSQQTQPKIESNQRRVMIGPDNNISRESDWRVLNGSHPFSSQMSQNESQDCEQQQQRIKEQQYRREQRKKQQKLREQNERKEKEKYEEALEQLRIQQEHRLKIRQQEEERRRAEEQLRLQEIRRQHEERQYQERQRLYQQEVERRAEEQRRNEEFRRRTEEQLRLQEQKMKGQLYTDVNGDEERRRLVDQGDSSNWRQFKAPPHHQQYVQS
ncbi:unnamed protein product [Onchocerca ochengi]|uniref:CCDC66 domain-containing protein n=1 Tax=Onchocerca ochengi TaxID=42157 RepID=A0A182EQ28_ONCOC|nr:unnamed protein product [Onchocerca ochengi]